MIDAVFFSFQPFLQTLPRLLDAPSVENVNAKVVSCGARHSAIVTGTSLFICIGVLFYVPYDS